RRVLFRSQRSAHDIVAAGGGFNVGADLLFFAWGEQDITIQLTRRSRHRIHFYGDKPPYPQAVEPADGIVIVVLREIRALSQVNVVPEYPEPDDVPSFPYDQIIGPFFPEYRIVLGPVGGIIRIDKDAVQGVSAETCA